MTTSDLPVSSPSGLPEGGLLGARFFSNGARRLRHCGCMRGLGRNLISDANFHDWPLGSGQSWSRVPGRAKGGRRFTMLAVSYDDVIWRHARFVGGAALGITS